VFSTNKDDDDDDDDITVFRVAMYYGIIVTEYPDTAHLFFCGSHSFVQAHTTEQFSNRPLSASEQTSSGGTPKQRGL